MVLFDNWALPSVVNIGDINNGVMKVVKRISLLDPCELSALNTKMNWSKIFKRETV